MDDTNATDRLLLLITVGMLVLPFVPFKEGESLMRSLYDAVEVQTHGRYDYVRNREAQEQSAEAVTAPTAPEARQPADTSD